VDLKEIGFENVDWIFMTQDIVQWHAVMNIVMNVWVPQKTEDYLTAISLSRRTLLCRINLVS
jgi:hypothetical protein